MKVHVPTLATAGALLIAMFAPDAALAQKSGGILRIPHGDSPASMSTHEEATRSTATPMMGVFNNLVIFDQHVPRNTLSSIVPDLALDWSWDEDKTALTFHLRQDVRWHDGKPFSAKDVKCTWDLLTGKSTEKLRVNPRRSWYRNLQEVTVDSNSARLQEQEVQKAMASAEQILRQAHEAAEREHAHMLASVRMMNPWTMMPVVPEYTM